MGWFDEDDDEDEEEELQRRRQLKYGTASAGGAGGEDGDAEEEDPLDAFMSTLHQTAAAADDDRDRMEDRHQRDSGGGGGRGRLDWDGEDEATGHWHDEPAAAASGGGVATASATAAGIHDDDDDDDDYFDNHQDDQQKRSAGNALDSMFHKAGSNRKKQDDWWNSSSGKFGGGERRQEGAAAAAASDSARQQEQHRRQGVSVLAGAELYLPRSTPDGQKWRDDNGVHCQPAAAAVDPIYDMQELRDAFGDKLCEKVREMGLHRPTTVQSQTLPVALTGRDCLVTAPTGQGKTLAYAWPLVVHVATLREQQQQQQPASASSLIGPLALVLVPTRELAQQVTKQIQPMLRAATASFGGGDSGTKKGSVCKTIIGGQGRYVLWQELQRASGEVDVVVATPGRLLDVLVSTKTPSADDANNGGSSKSKRGLSLIRTSFIVLDEADKMLAMGFEAQVREVLTRVGVHRSQRQTMMLSATLNRRVERVAREWLRLKQLVRIAVGATGEASEHVEQHVMVLPNDNAKKQFLLELLPTFASVGRTLVFVATRKGVEDLASAIRERQNIASSGAGDGASPMRIETLHGDKHQSDRNKAFSAFKAGRSAVLIATDVASRGLDVPHVTTVVNADVAKNLDSHVHRIGRAGRLDTSTGQHETGTAYTLLTPRDAEFAHTLKSAWEREGREVPAALRELAEKSKRGGGGGSARVSGQSHRSGLGYDHRPPGNGSSAPPAKRSRWGER